MTDSADDQASSTSLRRNQNSENSLDGDNERIISTVLSVTSDEVNYLIFRYMQECGYVHSAFTFAHESMLGRTGLRNCDKTLPPGALITFLQKGLQYVGLEERLDEKGKEPGEANVEEIEGSLLSLSTLNALCRPHPVIQLNVPPASAAAVLKAKLEAEAKRSAERPKIQQEDPIHQSSTASMNGNSSLVSLQGNSLMPNAHDAVNLADNVFENSMTANPHNVALARQALAAQAAAAQAAAAAAMSQLQQQIKLSSQLPSVIDANSMFQQQLQQTHTGAFSAMELLTMQQQQQQAAITALAAAQMEQQRSSSPELPASASLVLATGNMGGQGKRPSLALANSDNRVTSQAQKKPKRDTDTEWSGNNVGYSGRPPLVPTNAPVAQRIPTTRIPSAQEEASVGHASSDDESDAGDTIHPIETREIRVVAGSAGRSGGMSQMSSQPLPLNRNQPGTEQYANGEYIRAREMHTKDNKERRNPLHNSPLHNNGRGGGVGHSLPIIGMDDKHESHSEESPTELDDSNTEASPDEIIQLQMHESEVFMCAWNPVFTNLIATGSGDASARIWEMNGNTTKAGIKSVKTLPHGTDPHDKKNKDVTTLEWSTDGQYLATGSYDGVARVWARTGALLYTLRKHSGPIFSLKWNRNSNYILSGSYDTTAIVWDVSESKPDPVVQQFADHKAPTLDVDWRDNETFATCSTDKNVHVYRVGEKWPIKVYRGHKDEVNAVKWDPSGKFLASCSDDCTAKVWEIENDRDCPRYSFTSHSQEIYTVKWSPTGAGSANPGLLSLLATASFDATVRLWNIVDGSCYRIFNRHRDSVYSVSFSPSGEFLASGSLAGQMYVWHIQRGEHVKSFKGSGDIFEVAWNKEESMVAACFSSNVVTVMDFDKSQIS